MGADFPRHGLYAISDPALVSPERLASAVEQAILGGAAVIQYRNKVDGADERRRQAMGLRQVCREYQVPLIVNDDVSLAREVNADGVHLGKDDLGLAEARSLLSDRAIIGVSCYNQPERALAAQAEGADYVAFGRFFSSISKPAAVGANPAMLRQVRPKIHLPIVVIGGITPENGASLLEAGADLLAVIHGVFGQSDPQSAALRYAALFRRVAG